MSTESFDLVSKVIGDAMDEAWNKIIGDLASAARGEADLASIQSAVPKASVLSLEHIQGFFKVAGGANLAIAFPAVLPKQPIGLFYAHQHQTGVQSAMATKLAPSKVTGSISIGVQINF